MLISLIKYEVFRNHDSFLQKEQKPYEALIRLESSGNLQWPHVLATCHMRDLALSVAGRGADTTMPFTLPGVPDRVLVELHSYPVLKHKLLILSPFSPDPWTIVTF